MEESFIVPSNPTPSCLYIFHGIFHRNPTPLYIYLSFDNKWPTIQSHLTGLILSIINFIFISVLLLCLQGSRRICAMISKL